MKRFLHLVDETSHDDLLVDPDLSLVTAYVSRELSIVELMAVEERLRTDAAFRDRVQFVLDSVALPFSFAAEFGVTPPEKNQGGRVAALAVRQHAKAPSIRSLKRIAAALVVTALPVIMLAQVVVYVGQRVEKSRGNVEHSIAAANRGAQQPVPDAPQYHSDIALDDHPVGRQLQAVASPAVLIQQQPPLRTLTTEMRIVSSDSIPQTQLTRASDVLVAPDGFIFVVDMSTEIGPFRLYDPNGKFVRSFGRLGDGPSEFRANTEIIGAAGDTVLILDRQLGRIQVFRRNGTFVRTHILEGVPRERTLRGYLSSGIGLFSIFYITRFPQQDSAAWRIIDPAQREIARIAVQKSPPLMFGIPRVAGSYPQPFVAEVHTAQDPMGNRALAALPSIYWSGQPGQVKLVLMNSGGIQSERIVNVGAQRQTDALREAWIKEKLDAIEDLPGKLRAQSMTRAVAEGKLREQIIRSQYVPEIEGAMLSNDGSIWLKRHVPDDWILVAPTGAIVARVQVPAGIKVFQVSKDRLWGVTRDVDGVPSVVRYRLSPG